MKKVDGMIELEQCGHPGNIGDSCAETCRFYILDPHIGLKPSSFITPTGFIRHPSAPEGWRENDFSNDQLLPLLLVHPYCDIGLFKIKGTKTFISLGCHLVRLQMWRTLNVVNYIQGLLLKVPLRWSDERMRPEWAPNASADFLNYAIIFIRLKQLGFWHAMPHTADEVEAKLRAYYRPEPNSEILIQSYLFWLHH